MVDSDIDSYLERSHAARYPLLIDGAAIEGSTLECPAITRTPSLPGTCRASGIGRMGLGQGPRKRVAVSHARHDLDRVGHVVVRDLLVMGCTRFVLLSLEGAR